MRVDVDYAGYVRTLDLRGRTYHRARAIARNKDSDDMSEDGSVQLSSLLQSLLHKAYHDLSLLSEL